MLPGEKKILTELLKMYKDFPYLWDRTHLLYYNKESRRKAFELLLEKYRSCNETATMDVMKKKIDNMRTTYKREMKKVLAARTKGVKEYRPSLWYFDLMSFVDNGDFSCSTSDHTTSDMDEEENEDSEVEYLDEEPQQKRRKLYSPVAGGKTVSTDNLQNQQPDISRVFLTSHNNESFISVNNDDELSSERDLSHDQAIAFGRSIGLQLKELDSLQRIIAEKLISDTIFYVDYAN